MDDRDRRSNPELLSYAKAEQSRLDAGDLKGRYLYEVEMRVRLQDRRVIISGILDSEQRRVEGVEQLVDERVGRTVYMKLVMIRSVMLATDPSGAGLHLLVEAKAMFPDDDGSYTGQLAFRMHELTNLEIVG